MDTKIKILFLAANPNDTAKLRLDEEIRSIDLALQQSEYRNNFDIKQHWAVRVADLQSYLLRHKPNIVHFSGHGSSSSEIILEDNHGDSKPVPTHALSQLFNLFKDNIRCVVLNACYSKTQAEAIAKHIDCVIGMSKAIGDEAAINFAKAFYQVLGFGRDVKTAFDSGCLQIDLESLNEQNTPKLITINSNPKEIVFVNLPSTSTNRKSANNFEIIGKQSLTNRECIEYDVFISHAGEDTEWCEQLAVRLRDAGLQVWFDKWQMREAGINLIKAMNEGLGQSRRAVMVLTPAYLREDKIWAAAESEFITYQDRTGRREFAIPLFLQDCTPPPLLRPLKYLDFRNPAVYEVTLQQLVGMLKGAPVDDATPTLMEITDTVPALGQLPPNSYLPYEWNPHFVGRDEELKKLHRLLNRGENVVAVNQVGGKVAMTGFGGYGKTQLAVTYTFRYGRFYTGGVYWVNAERSENLQSSLAALAISMGLNLPTELPVKDCAARVLAVLRRPEPSLLILDNVEDPAVLAQGNVAGGGCRVLITTRRTDLERVEQLPIDVLEKEPALALLLSRRSDLQLPTNRSEQLDGISEKICERLGHLPLALELAAFYLGRHKRLSLEDYFTELENVGALDHAALLGANYKQSPTGYERGVAESFQLSFRELANAPNAQRLFLAACQFAPESINPNLLGKIAGLDLITYHGEEALNLLLDLSLCKQNENGRLQLHRLVIDFGQRVKPEKNTTELQERFIETMLKFIEATNYVTKLKETQPELQHVIHAAELAVSHKTWPKDFELCNQIGDHYIHRSDYSKSLFWFKRAQQICESHQPLDEIYFANSLNNVGYALLLLPGRDLNKALLLHQQALAIRKRLFGDEHPDVAESLNHIGSVLWAQGDLPGALTHHQQALTIRKRFLEKSIMR